MAGALDGVRIIELAGLGPAPFAAMMLADHGAEVIRIERPGGGAPPPGPGPDNDILLRSRRVLTVDLKHPDGAGVVRALARSADGLIEGFRPGVMERLGLGPDVLLADRPALVYGRMTGWGQTGPLAQAAGHDINYIALAGALHGFGRPGGKPTPPANLVGDFGGGGMLLAFGMLAGILRARLDGTGQVIDCAMVDGAALLQSMTYSFLAQEGGGTSAASTCWTAARRSTTRTRRRTECSSRSARWSLSSSRGCWSTQAWRVGRSSSASPTRPAGRSSDAC